MMRDVVYVIANIAGNGPDALDVIWGELVGRRVSIDDLSQNGQARLLVYPDEELDDDLDLDKDEMMTPIVIETTPIKDISIGPGIVEFETAFALYILYAEECA